MAFTENSDAPEKVILVGISTWDGDDTADSLNELGELARTAGAETVGVVIQNRERMDPATYVGKGKAEEIRGLIDSTEATGIICDDELTPAQMNNLTKALDAKVMDRTMLILDIFAKHASTSEGKLQVELAQLKYRASRLTGLGTSLSRLGGGIGTRGPGEKKLEMDRRLIKSRISRLGQELREVRQHRDVTRQKRSREGVPVIAVVGYTNAGKSTLLNTLTGAGILEEDKLFATLDPTTRRLTLPSGQQALLTDTVGFIRKLPHHLIEAFGSTLEEAKYADIIVHVVDISNPQAEKQAHIVYETLERLGVKDKPIITLLNKCDLPREEDEPVRDTRADYTITISAKYGQGLDRFQEVLEQELRNQRVLIERTLSYKEAGVLALIREQGEIQEEDYRPEGVYVKAYVPLKLYHRL